MPTRNSAIKKMSKNTTRHYLCSYICKFFTLFIMSLKDIFKEKAYEKKGTGLTAYNHFSTFCKDLENFDIQAFNAYSMKFGRYLSEKGLKNSSINVYLKILKNFLKNNGGNPELIL